MLASLSASASARGTLPGSGVLWHAHDSWVIWRQRCAGRLPVESPSLRQAVGELRASISEVGSDRGG